MMITWDLLDTICSAIILLGGAWAIIGRAMNKIKKPINDINEKIEEMKQTDKQGMARIEQHEARLNTHKEMLDKMLTDNKMIMKSLLLLLAHAETGNNTGEVAKGRKELEDHLIDKD